MSGPSVSSDPPRALRVKLPLRQHLALHRLKLRTGRSMASVIEDALDRYLAGNPEFSFSDLDGPMAPEGPQDDTPGA